MREELEQLRKQKAQCDVRNSRQRVAMARLVKRHELLLKERDNLKQENEKLKEIISNANEFMQDIAIAEEEHGFFDGAEIHIFAQLQSILKDKEDI